MLEVNRTFGSKVIVNQSKGVPKRRTHFIYIYLCVKMLTPSLRIIPYQNFKITAFLMSRVRIRLKILYSNFLFIHYEAEVGIWFYIVKTAIHAEICVAKCLKCGAFCSLIQSNSHPAYVSVFLTQLLKDL